MCAAGSLMAAKATPTRSRYHPGDGFCRTNQDGSNQTVASISLSSTPASEITADAVVVGITKGDDGPALASGAEALDAAYGGSLRSTLAALGATGKAGEITKVAGAGSVTAPVIVAVGLGPADGSTSNRTPRRAAGSSVLALAGTRPCEHG